MFGKRSTRLAHVCVLTMALGAAAHGQEAKIWAGVYTGAQAARGKVAYEASCSACHKSDLSGERGPALGGDGFFSSWETASVGRLYTRIKETMPRNRGGTLSEDNYLSIVAYLLQANGFPASADDTELEVESLEDIRIARKGTASPGVPNFALIEVVGCLAQDQSGQWSLTRTSEPVLTKNGVPVTQELKAGTARPLGTDTFVLHSTFPFKPDGHKGQKMEARGLLYRSPPNHSRISLTSLRMVDERCGN